MNILNFTREDRMRIARLLNIEDLRALVREKELSEQKFRRTMLTSTPQD
jgi:hypothetical protein